MFYKYTGVQTATWRISVEIFGMKVELGHIISAIGVIFSIVFSLGLGAWVMNWYNRRRGRAFGRIIVSRNEIGELKNGKRQLRLRNIGEEMTLDKVILDPTLRRLMVAAGKENSTTRQFVMLETHKLQEEMLHAIGNHLTRHFFQGEIAASLHLPYVEKEVLFSVTCSDGPKGDIRKFRIVWIGGDSLEYCSDASVMYFEKGRENHVVRANTLARMHKVHHSGGTLPYSKKDPTERRVIGSIMVKAPTLLSQEQWALLMQVLQRR